MSAAPPQPRPPRMPGGDRFFYGWWLVLAGMLNATAQGLFLGFGFSAFFLPIQADMDTNRAMLSLAFSLSQLEAGFTGPVNAYLLDRFGPRKIMTIGYLIFASGYMLMSQVHSILPFYAAYVLTALGVSLSGFLPVSVTITRWFSRRRGIAIGVSQCGDGIGGMLVPLLALSIATFGWRETALFAGPIILLVGLPIASLFRGKPEDVGLLPDGDKPEQERASSSRSPAERPLGYWDEPNISVWQALRMPAFWFIACAHSFTLFMVTAVNIHHIPALVSNGLDYNTAALVLSVTTGSTVAGRLFFGFLGDRFNHQWALAGCFLAQAAGVLFLAYAQDIVMALVFAVLYGLAFGGRGPLLIGIRSEFFGRRSFATIMGISQTVLMIGTISGPVFAGWVYDVTQSYAIAFWIMAAINVFSMGLILLARKPTYPPVRRVLEGDAARGG